MQSCYDDVSDIIEQLATKNDIEQLSHYIYSHLCKYGPLKGIAQECEDFIEKQDKTEADSYKE